MFDLSGDLDKNFLIISSADTDQLQITPPQNLKKIFSENSFKFIEHE